jgi:hypothetical protein
LEKKFCPFIGALCRDDCVFKYHNVAGPGGKAYNCLIAIKLNDINEYQHDDLSSILDAIEKKKP